MDIFYYGFILDSLYRIVCVCLYGYLYGGLYAPIFGSLCSKRGRGGKSRGVGETGAGGKRGGIGRRGEGNGGGYVYIFIFGFYGCLVVYIWAGISI